MQLHERAQRTGKRAQREDARARREVGRLRREVARELAVNLPELPRRRINLFRMEVDGCGVLNPERAYRERVVFERICALIERWSASLTRRPIESGCVNADSSCVPLDSYIAPQRSICAIARAVNLTPYFCLPPTGVCAVLQRVQHVVVCILSTLSLQMACAMRIVEEQRQYCYTDRSYGMASSCTFMRHGFVRWM